MEVNTTLKTPKLNQFNLSKDLVDGSKILNKLFISAPPFFFMCVPEAVLLSFL